MTVHVFQQTQIRNGILVCVIYDNIFHTNISPGALTENIVLFNQEPEKLSSSVARIR